MKVLICGDRKWGAVNRIGTSIVPPKHNYSKIVYRAMKSLTPNDSVIEGEANGADVLARIICELRDIPYDPIPADWCDFGAVCSKPHAHHGKLAGNLRNKEMAEKEPDEVWAFHDDLTVSKGTLSMVRIAWSNMIPVKWFSPDHPDGVPIKDMGDIQKYKVYSKTVPFNPDEIPF